MHFTKVLPLAALLAPLVAAELDFDRDDVPSQCMSVCDPIHSLVRQCDVDDDLVGGDANEDNLERQCVCSNRSIDVARVAALCAGCMSQHVRERDDMEDINDLMRACGFQSTSFAPEATSFVQGTVSVSKVTNVDQLTTSFPQETGNNGNNNNNQGNQGQNNNDDGNAGAAVGIPSMLVCLAGAFVAGGMVLQ